MVEEYQCNGDKLLVIHQGGILGMLLREKLQDITNIHTHLAILPQPQSTLQKLHHDFIRLTPRETKCSFIIKLLQTWWALHIG